MNIFTLKHWAAALSVALLAGCSSPSVITLVDGRQVFTKDTPVLDEDSGFYQFKQTDGEQAQVNKDQVKLIERQ